MNREDIEIEVERLQRRCLTEEGKTGIVVDYIMRLLKGTTNAKLRYLISGNGYYLAEEIEPELAALRAEADELKAENSILAEFFVSIHEIVGDEDLPSSYAYDKIEVIESETSDKLAALAVGRVTESEMK